MTGKKFPLRVLPENGSQQFKVATSMDKLAYSQGSLERELRFVEFDYAQTVLRARAALSLARENKRPDPRLFWLAGHALLDFLSRIDDIGFYLVQQNRSLARDITLSESSIEKILAFSRRFRAISKVDPAVAWNRYRANKVPRPEQTI